MSQFLHNLFILPWQDAGLLFWPLILQGVLVSCALGLLGCFLVVRGMSLLGDALSHAVLPGIAIGFFASAHFGTGSLRSPWILVGATLTGLAAAILVELVQKQSRVKEDASLGIVFTTLFAFGVVLISRYGGQADLDPGCVLYGNIEHFTSFDGRMPDKVYPMMFILGLIVVGIIVFYRQLLICTFDPALAVSVGITAWLVHYGLMTALSLTIVASFEAVGAILAVALLILPGATARLWTHKLAHMLWFSVAFGIVSTVVGYWLSHKSILNTSAGAAIVAAGFFMFMASWLFAPRSGLISAWRTRRRLRRTIALENLIKAIAEIAAAKHSEVERTFLSAIEEHSCSSISRDNETREDKNVIAKQTGMSAPLQNTGSGGASPFTSVSLTDLNRELHWTEDRLEKIAAAGVLRGWISRSNDSLSLTSSGVARGEKLEAAHLAWEAYLQNQLNLPADHVHDAAEWIEHYLEETDLAEIRAPVAR